MTRRILIPLLAAALACPSFAQEASDGDLQTNLEMKLRGNPMLLNVSIRGTVRHKKARLEGTVRTLSQAWEAWEIASKILGVTEIDDALVIGTSGKNDTALRAEVERRLANIVRLMSSPPVVTVSGGTVTLSGTLKDARHRFSARTATAGIEGVRAIIDDFTTEPVEDEKVQAGVDGLFGRRARVVIPGDTMSELRVDAVVIGPAPAVTRAASGWASSRSRPRSSSWDGLR